METGEVERIIEKDKYNVEYYDLSGSYHTIKGDISGNVYYDGELVVESIKENIAMTRASSPWGNNWKYLTTAKTEQTLYDATCGLAVAILSFVPGCGVVSGIASIVMAFVGMNRPTAYYK